jgi:OOP family OmpA-OmpF porin
LFDFNKATLKPAGEQALTDLVGQIGAEASTDAAITIVGHTDRIGSEQYNLDLSRRRAQTVADFLVAKGVPRNQVGVEGAGESSPVTGSQCDSVKGRAALISCLAPDRRVVVVVRGTTTSQ